MEVWLHRGVSGAVSEDDDVLGELDDETARKNISSRNAKVSARANDNLLSSNQQKEKF
jgi:hypothetical protein